MNLSNQNIEILKSYGIIDKDGAFSSRIPSYDIKRFLEGQKLVATHGKERAVFQVESEDKPLKVSFFSLEKEYLDLEEEKMKGKILYSRESETSPLVHPAFSETTLAYQFNEKNSTVVEYNLLDKASLVIGLLKPGGNIDLLEELREELLKMRSETLASIRAYPKVLPDLKERLSSVSRSLREVKRVKRNIILQTKEKQNIKIKNLESRNSFELSKEPRSSI